MDLSNKKMGVKIAYEKGYRVINNEVVYNGKSRKLYKHIKKRDKNTLSYYSFGIRDTNGKRVEIYVHQLLAYQKYGELMFNEEIEVRHLDGNSLNNSEENVLIGTKSQNRNDYLKRKKQEDIITIYPINDLSEMFPITAMNEMINAQAPMRNMDKELEKEAKEYAKSVHKNHVLKTFREYSKNDFKAGACSKFVERQKIEFAINQLQIIMQKINSYDNPQGGAIKQDLQIQIYHLKKQINNDNLKKDE